jgi:orotidine-5'-phosphate decarboxylase
VARNFQDLLRAQTAQRHFLCVGLDCDAGKLPVEHLELDYSDDELLLAQDAYRRMEAAFESGDEDALEVSEIFLAENTLADAQLAFNKRIIDATKDFVAAYKPNSAFYEALGPAGLQALRATISYIRLVAPSVIVILDFKRADIGNTNRGYVAAAMAADGLTLNPYFGWQAMEPFLKLKQKGLFFLCKTSNPGADELQDLPVRVYVPELADYNDVELPLYQVVARHVSRQWNFNHNCGLVVGATYPEDLRKVRDIAGQKTVILSPGLGSQGAPLEEAAAAGRTENGDGVLFNNSSAILFASSGPDFAEAAAEKAEENMVDIRRAMAA